MRVFFAIPVPVELCLEIDHWRSKTLPPMTSAIPMQNFHLTLAFLGPIKADRMEQLCTLCEDYLNEKAYESFELELNESGFWPKTDIYWIGPRQWPKHLNQLAKGLSMIGGKIGARPSKHDYRPHLSLFRGKALSLQGRPYSKTMRQSKIMPSLEPMPQPLIEPDFVLPCDAVGLFESVQTKGGTQYQELISWTLGSESRNDDMGNPRLKDNKVESTDETADQSTRPKRRLHRVKN